MLQRQEGLQLATLDDVDIDWSSWTGDDNYPLVQYSDDVSLAGHSFGGCTVVRIIPPVTYASRIPEQDQFHLLSSPPPSWASPIPITRSLVHDPWLDPIPSPGPTPLEQYKVSMGKQVSSSSQETLVVNNKTDQESSLPELLVINSQAFTLWDEHFNRLRKVNEAWGAKATLLTLGSLLLRRSHPDTHI